MKKKPRVTDMSSALTLYRKYCFTFVLAFYFCQSICYTNGEEGGYEDVYTHTPMCRCILTHNPHKSSHTHTLQCFGGKGILTYCEFKRLLFTVTQRQYAALLCLLVRCKQYTHTHSYSHTCIGTLVAQADAR